MNAFTTFRKAFSVRQKNGKANIYIYFLTAMQDRDVNLIQDGGGGGQKETLTQTSFTHLIFKNEVISPKNVLTFSFNPFSTLV